MKPRAKKRSTKRSLLDKALVQFVICTVILLLVATPLFYLLTKHFYAEDMIDIIEAVKQGEPIPSLDLEEDILQGIMLQYLLISGILGIAITLTMRFITSRLWKPFDATLQKAEQFRLENGQLPDLPDSDVKEFEQLNHTLLSLMQNNLNSYRVQKEFTENASHELQTPLAIIQSKLDLFLQQPELSKQQADIIQSLYQTTNRLTHLNRSLLLLAKIENNQYEQTEEIDLVAFIRKLLPQIESLTENLSLQTDFQTPRLAVKGNRTLLESLMNNLIVNAIRHNYPNGEIIISINEGSLTVSNTSPNESALDVRLIFNRFYRTSENIKGYGLGLAIVKAICEYHQWEIKYIYYNKLHHFRILF